jgi:hypothetical protein
MQMNSSSDIDMKDSEAIGRRDLLRALVGTAALPAVAQYPRLNPPPAGEAAVRSDGSVTDLFLSGELFAVYNHDTSQAGNYRPFFHPILAPNRLAVTQNGEFPGSLRGHHWHRGLFVAHQKVNDVSFWEERAADCGKIVHLGFDLAESGAVARLRQRLAWRDLTGRDLLQETRYIEARSGGANLRLLDLGLRLQALDRPVVFHKTMYNLLACRVPDSMCLPPQKERYTKLYGPLVNFHPMDRFGVITNSEGQQNEACGGARARWCDFSGPLVDGSVAGVALMDHPANPRFPTRWHNWNNMTIMASFTYDEAFELKPGQALALNYRVAVHTGDARQAGIPEVWVQYSKMEPLAKEKGT